MYLYLNFLDLRLYDTQVFEPFRNEKEVFL